MLNFVTILSKFYLRKIVQFNIYLNNEEINVEFIKSRKIKHNYLKIIDEKNLRVKGNCFFTQNDAKAFIYSKSGWIEKHIKQIKSKKISSNEFFYLGNKYTHKSFEEIMGKSIENLDEFYKDKANKIIPNIVSEYSDIMQLYPNSLKFRKNKSRWGSCSFKNSINLNIYMMKLPYEAIEYIVVHELAHIKHKNHSKVFWDLVEKYNPDYKKIEKILKKY